MQKYKKDANTQLFLERELESLESTLYNVRYPNLKARALIPPKFDYPRGTETITYKQYDMVGVAKIIANYANDLPRVSLTAKKFTSPVKRLGASYAFSIDDIDAAAMAGIPLDQMEAMAAKRAIDQKENQIAYFGDTSTGLPGFFTNPNIPTGTVDADGVGASPLWDNKDPELIIRDVNQLINDIKTNSLGVELPNTVLFPVTAMAKLASSPISAAVPNTTILDFLKKVHPYITLWDELNELETAGSGGTRMMVAYDRNPMTLRMPIPADFQVFPAQEKGLEFEIPVSEKVGGTIVSYPLACNFLDGF